MIAPRMGADFTYRGAQLPSISLLTICKNAEATIARTLDSVYRCGYPQLEYVVVDGGSSDATIDIIRHHPVRVDKFISEPDRGISDALNKAVSMSDGDYHLIVHADDLLLPNALELMADSSNSGTAMVICASVQVMGENGTVRKFVPDPGKLVEKMSVPHMGSLIRKRAWEAVGGYDLRRRVAMDHLLMLRILNRFGPGAFSVVDALVAHYFLGGVSDQQVNAGFREVRDNLLEEGVGRFRADAAYARLLIKSKIARLIGVL